MPPVSYISEPRPAALDRRFGLSGAGSQIRALLDRFKPILIDQIMLQIGWPLVGIRLSLREILIWSFVLFIAPK